MKFEGEITEIDLLPKLVELSEQRFTGALRFENDTIIKIVYFKDGEVLSASTNDRADSIDEILLRSSKVSKEHIKQALARRKENETLGDALLNLGFITRKELTWARRAQVIGILRSLGAWTEGSYTLVADYLPKREEGTSFHLPQLVVELLVTEEDRGRVEQAMQGGDAVFEVAPDGDEKYRRLGLNEDADAILARIDGTRTAAELAEGSAMDTFSVFKLLQALYVLAITRPAAAASIAGVAATGATAPLELNESLELSFDDSPALPEFGVPAAPTVAPAAALPTDDEWQPPSVDLSRDDYSLDYQDEPLNFDDAPALPTPPPVIVPPPAMPASTASVESSPLAEVPLSIPNRPTPAFVAPVKKRSRVPLVAALALIVLAAGGYAAWRYFAAVEPPATAQVAATRSQKRAALPPAVPTSTTTAAVALPVEAAAPATTTSVVPASAPLETSSPAPAVTSSSDPRRARYEQMAREFATESAASPYAVQVAFVCETSSLTTALEAGGGADIWFVPAERGGRSCFRVLWGRYSDRKAATSGVGSVPALYRKGRPVVVKLSQVVSR